MNTEATEYSKSGTDDEAARREDAAFDPNMTDPQKQKDKAGEGHDVCFFHPFRIMDRKITFFYSVRDCLSCTMRH